MSASNIFETLDGYPYQIKTLGTYINQTFPANQAYIPNIIIKQPSAAVPAAYSIPKFKSLQIVVDTDKGIIPLYYSISLYTAAGGGGIPQFGFSTPFLVDVQQNTIAPFNFEGTASSKQYGLKIAPFGQRVLYELKGLANGCKEFIGDLNMINNQSIEFHSADFLKNRPNIILPTDGQKWYLGYVENGSIGPAQVVTYQDTALLSYKVSAGLVANQAVSFTYLELL
jgi:hypothetical protein